MLSSLSKLTGYHVADTQRPWGKIRDFLVEFPAGKARYFSVDAPMGGEVKEIWAPLETVGRVDPEHQEVLVRGSLEPGMEKRLSSLEFPANDRDELRLHRLYATRPDWSGIRHKNRGPLRKQTRLLRGSKLIGFEAMTRQGMRGLVLDLLFDDKELTLLMLRLLVSDGFRDHVVDMKADCCGRIYPEAHAIYMHAD